MKKLIAFVLILILLFAMTGCGTEERNVSGKSYTYEKAGAGGDFTISLRENGTFTYYEGIVSSYIGRGTWSVTDSVITLTEEALPVITLSGEVKTGKPFVNHFRISGDDLVFIEDNSSNFLHVDVRDGEVFRGAPSVSDAQQMEG